MHLLTDLIEDGMPKTRNEMPVSIRQFHVYRHELSTTDGVAIYKDRVIIPPALRHAVLAALHAAHQGVSMMTARAETSIFWPGMTEDIAKVRNECDHCHRMAPSQPASRAAHPPHLARLPIPSDMLRLLLIQGRALRSSCRSLLELAHHRERIGGRGCPC